MCSLLADSSTPTEREALEPRAIYQPIQEELAEVENRLSSVSKVEFNQLSELLRHSLKGGGKRIRPALVLLSGKFYDYNPPQLILMATAVELFHIATLVHDDTVDNSAVRHWQPTVNKIWGQDAAVLLGDYLFAKAGEFTSSTKNLRVIKLSSHTLMTISSGEINQAFSAFNLEQNFQDYLGRISSKTASLFSMATESGAVLSHAPEKSIQALKGYSYNLGIAFQIVDDILDFIATDEEMGKPIGSDLAQGTLTLPAMFLLERYPENNPVKRLFQNRDKQENIKLAIELVRNSSIVQDCYSLASDYCARACQNLKQLPDKSARQPLIELANYVINRKR